MADISAIRSALQSRLSTLLSTGGNAYAYAQTQPMTPCFHILGFGTEYDEVFGRGGDELSCTIQGVAGKGLDEAAQRQIDDWLDTSGASSVKAALETERASGQPVTLGGTVASCRVTGHTRPFITRFDDGAEAWAVDFTLELHT